MHLAQSLDLVLNKQIEELSDWLLLSDLNARIEAINATLPRLTAEQFAAHSREVETRWPGLTERDAELQAILTNDISKELKSFQSVCPLYAEIFVTDMEGQLVASTEKTSDYLQSDENWWQKAFQMPAGHAHVEGINFDESAGVYSVDVAIPIRHFGGINDPPAGVIKGVLNSSPLFASARGILFGDHQPVRLVVLDDGRILAGLFGKRVVPLQERISQAAMQRIRPGRPGWMVEKLNNGNLELVGFAPIRLTGRLIGETVTTGLKPLYVVVYDDAAAVLAPVRRQLWLLSVTGGFIVVGFSLAGLYIANRKIIAPIQLLRSAAQAVASSAKLDEAAEAETPATGRLTPARSDDPLERIKQVRTSDELEELARDFNSMAKRVLRYHEQLEEEIAIKTGEIQRDLQFAKEFQEALMPRNFPRVSGATADALTLNFDHVYKPTSSVGGDFFDVLKLSEHCAGIFIADVMGHGARSALVTAILRTFLQDLVAQASNPARFLSLINQHFYDMVQQSNQVVFVSAFYLVIDTQNGLATYASAGHPSPLLADRARKNVATLVPRLENNPALGLFRDSAYTSFTSFVKKEEVFILFTDGIVEATSPDGEQFGRDRLAQVIEQNIDRDAGGLNQAIVEAVNEFVKVQALADDICLVAVEVSTAKAVAAAART
jgi:serine phosphatase RsbU (regulator of sigma subunit)